MEKMCLLADIFDTNKPKMSFPCVVLGTRETHRQFVIEAFESDVQAVVSR